MQSIRRFALAVVLLSGVWSSDCRAQAALADRPAHVPEGFSLQWQPNFDDDGILQQLEFTDAKAWRPNKHEGRAVLELVGNSRYTSKVRSPSSIALLTTRRFGDFLLEAELLQTGRDYGHRDLCLFFGFQDPGHYYYVHFASKTDPEANQIFIVNEKPFTKISTKTTAGSHWGQNQWHRVRVQRIGNKISVWFDDMTTPAMLAEDASFGAGYLGFGSFNDSGMFAQVRVWAPAVEEVERNRDLFKAKAAARSASAGEFRPIFDGRTLDGWKALNMSYWTVEDGAITGQSTPQNPCTLNQFLVWQGGDVTDFELKLQFRVTGNGCNSGVQFRSEIRPDGLAVGYQADIYQSGPYLGGVCDELHQRNGPELLTANGSKTVIDASGKRTSTELGSAATMKPPGEWNEYHITAKGQHIILRINGVACSELIDQEKGHYDLKGILGLQLRSGQPMKVQFKDVYYREF